MDKVTARRNFVLAFQYCWNGKEFPSFREIIVGEEKHIHTGYCAIDLLDEALNLHPDFQEARDLRSEIWHAILKNKPLNDYGEYLNSEAWAEIREELFEQMGRLCICGDEATEVHHKTYANIGKEDLTDLVGLCDRCHESVHQSENPNRANNVPAKVYWAKFKAYVAEKGNHLQLFPEPDLPRIYGIQIDRKTLESADTFKDHAFWLIAYRNANKLEANLCIRSPKYYSCLKKQKDIIKRKFKGNLDKELKWEDDGRRIGFSDNTVGHVDRADREKEFSWLHDRLLRLRQVFQPRVVKLQRRG